MSNTGGGAGAPCPKGGRLPLHGDSPAQSLEVSLPGSRAILWQKCFIPNRLVVS